VNGEKTESSSVLKGKTVRKNSWKEEKNAVATKLEEMQARKIAESFFSLASRPASCDKSASNSFAKARVKKGGNEKREQRSGNKGKKIMRHKQDCRNTCRLFRR